MKLQVKAVAGVVCTMLPGFHLGIAGGQAGVFAEDLVQASQRVHQFERSILAELGSGADDATSLHDSESVQHAVREFFATLEDPPMRIAAIDMLDNRYVYIMNHELASELVGPLIRDEDPRVRTRAARAVARIRCGKRYARELIAMAEGDFSAATLAQVAWAMGGSEHRSFEPYLVEMLGHGDGEVRAMALGALNELVPEAALERCVRHLEDRDPAVRLSAVQGLPGNPIDAASAAAEGMLADTEPRVRERAVWKLGQLENRGSADAIAERLSDENDSVRGRAAQVLGALRATQHADALAAPLNDPSVVARRYAVQALGAMGEPRLVEGLRPLLADEDQIIREWAEESIRQLTVPEP